MTATFTLTEVRERELRELLIKKKDRRGLVLFMDTINFKQEILALAPLFTEHANASQLKHFKACKKNIEDWRKPVLTHAFVSEFPIVSSKLDVPWKIRVFFRACHTRKVPIEIMAGVFEDILYRREVRHQDFLLYPKVSGANQFSATMRTMLSARFEYWTLTRLMFLKDPPKSYGIRISSKPDGSGLYINWRSE